MRDIVRDDGKLYMRASTVLPVGSQPLHVVSSEPVDQTMVDKIAQSLGELTLYTTGIEPRVEPEQSGKTSSSSSRDIGVQKNRHLTFIAGPMEKAWSSSRNRRR